MGWPATITVRQKDLQAKLGIQYDRDLYIEGTRVITEETKRKIVQIFKVAIEWINASAKLDCLKKEGKNDLGIAMAEQVVNTKARTVDYLARKNGISIPDLKPNARPPLVAELYITPEEVEELWNINLDRDLIIEGASKLTEENKPDIKNVLDSALTLQTRGKEVYKLEEEIAQMGAKQLDAERNSLRKAKLAPNRSQRERFNQYDKKELELKRAKRNVERAKQEKQELEKRVGLRCVSIFVREYIGKAGGAHLAFKLGIP